MDGARKKMETGRTPDLRHEASSEPVIHLVPVEFVFELAKLCIGVDEDEFEAGRVPSALNIPLVVVAAVAIAVEGFGAPRKLTRGTVVKMVDRLQKKGLLERTLQDHIFSYVLSRPLAEVESGYVGRFVQTRLKGEVAPLLAFLSETSELRQEEREAVQKIAERLKDEAP